MNRKSIFLILLIFKSLTIIAQDSIVSSISGNKGYLFNVHYTLHRPFMDLSERFITFNAIGAGVHFKTKSNFQFGIEYDWFYGQKVRDTSLFNSFEGPSGQITDENGNFTVYRLNIKGHLFMVEFGYTFRFNEKNPNTGLLCNLGIGYLQHKIDIQAPMVGVPQINGEYEKGYDRLSSGPAGRMFIGYQRLNQYQHFKFKAGLECNLGFTEGRRTWNYNTNSSGQDQRIDATFALRFGVILNVYTKDKEDEAFFSD